MLIVEKGLGIGGWKSGQRGFTLVETMVGMGVLTIFFGVVTATFKLVTDLVGESRVRVVAAKLASEKIERVRNLGYADVGTIGGIPNGTLAQSEVENVNGQEFVVVVNVVYIDDPFDDVAPTDPIATDYKRVKVSVSWEGAFPSKNPVVMITDAVPQGLETNEGGGTLIVTVINGSGETVTNALVKIVNGGVTPSIDLETVTDSTGRVILPGAPVCNECYEISATKSNYSVERTYARTEIANPLKPHPGVIEAEVTSMTFSIDQLSSLNVFTTGPRESNYPPFAGVQFQLTGTKIIGHDASDTPVVKYDESLASGPGGLLAVPDMEADTYIITIPNPSSVDYAGSNPISPFALKPGTSPNVKIVTAPATANNLLVVVQDAGQKGIATASAEISLNSGFIATKSAGVTGAGDFGQMLFSNLAGGNYSLKVWQVGYAEATASTQVSGDTLEYIRLEGE